MEQRSVEEIAGNNERSSADTQRLDKLLALRSNQIQWRVPMNDHGWRLIIDGRTEGEGKTQREAIDAWMRVNLMGSKLNDKLPPWRVGKKIPLNVYAGDRPVCQCHNANDAKLIVAAVNKMRESEGK